MARASVPHSPPRAGARAGRSPLTVVIHRGDCRDVLRSLPDESVLAYCAGVIDSDGTIGIKRSTYAMRKRGDCKTAVFSERIAVRQVEPQAVELLTATFGGSRYMTKPSVRNGKPLHTWTVTDRKAVECLRVILPFLRIKRAQAENCLELRAAKDQSKSAKVAFGRGHAGGAPRPAVLTERMENLYATGKALNAVGRSAARSAAHVGGGEGA